MGLKVTDTDKEPELSIQILLEGSTEMCCLRSLNHGPLPQTLLPPNFLRSLGVQIDVLAALKPSTLQRKSCLQENRGIKPVSAAPFVGKVWSRLM